MICKMITRYQNCTLEPTPMEIFTPSIISERCVLCLCVETPLPRCDSRDRCRPFQGEPECYSAEISLGNQTCTNMNFTMENLLHCPHGTSESYHCQGSNVALSESLGYRAPGHCTQGVALNQETDIIQTERVCRGPIYCKSWQHHRLRH